METSWWASRKFWLMWAGYAGAIAIWYASVKWLPIDSFNRLPDPWAVVREWLNPHPAYGISVFTPNYYIHILYSVYRATAAFFLTVLLGIPLGILMGWNRTFNAYASALVGLLRPVPPLAWIPLAILMFPGIDNGGARPVSR